MLFNPDYKRSQASENKENNEELISLPKTPIRSAEIQYGSSSRGIDASTAGLVMAILIAVTFIVTALYVFYVKPQHEAHSLNAAVAQSVGPVGGTAYNTDAFQNIALQARSAIVYDLTTNDVLFSHDADSEQPLASLTKLMTAIVALETLEENATVTITDASFAAEGDTGLTLEDSWNFSDLLDFTLITSSNDGAQAIAAAAGATLAGSSTAPVDEETLNRLTFVQQMNAKARELGLTHMNFTNASGLDVGETTSGSYGSARDVARLLAYMMHEHPDLLEVTAVEEKEFTSLTGATVLAHNTNARVGNVPGIFGSKTGFTDLAGGNLALLFDAGINRPVAVVVLGSTYEERFIDAELLAHKTLEYFTGPNN